VVTAAGRPRATGLGPVPGPLSGRVRRARGWRLHVRTMLLRAGGRTALVDTGVGGPASLTMRWFPAPGRLMGPLASSGTSPGRGRGGGDHPRARRPRRRHGDRRRRGRVPNARYLVDRRNLAWQEELARHSCGSRVWRPGPTTTSRSPCGRAGC
jgi:hypothetical protein